MEGINPTLKQHQHSTKGPVINQGCLVGFDESTGNAALLIESEAALVMREALIDYLAYSAKTQTWYIFTGHYWQALETGQHSDKIIYALLYPATDGLGFKPAYANGIKTMLASGDMLPMPEQQRGIIPFKNGLFDVSTKQLAPTIPQHALDWCLPYDYDTAAKCQNPQDWLTQAVDGDLNTVKFLRAWMAATLHGMSDLQKFLHLKGSGGTGKGVFMRLLTALVGSLNTVETSLEMLEGNRFESARLLGKRLCVITESDKYGGSINQLKAITGEDSIRLERKHQQQSSGFKFEGLVVMASNESLQTTDHTSGLDRRRLTVIFNRRASNEEKAHWASLGGEEAVIHSELPGLVNWLLELSKEEIRDTIRNAPKRITDANFNAMIASNPLADGRQTRD